MSTERPSVRFYLRDDPHDDAVRANIEEPYGFGAECALRDIAAELPPMTSGELSHLWHADYTEGYLDIYAAAKR